MSKLKVNELDTESGTTITVAAGKTIAGTDIIDTDQIASGAVGATELDATLDLSGKTVTLAAGEVSASEMATTLDLSGKTVTLAAGEVSASELDSTLDLSSKTVTLPAVSVTAHVTAYDDVGLRNDIATLALHSAIADNKAAFNLSNAFIDQYEDDTGLDVQTDCDREPTEYMSTIGSSGGNVSTPGDGTKLLLHFDGNFTDSSDNSVSTSGTFGSIATQTTTKKFGTHAAQFDGSDDYIEYAGGSGTPFQLGAGDWAIDFWAYPTSTHNEGTYRSFMGHSVQDSSNYIQLNHLNGTDFLHTHNNVLDATSGDVRIGDWVHILMQRANNNLKFWVGGVLCAPTAGLALTKNYDTTNSWRIGYDSSNSKFLGYMDELRVSDYAPTLVSGDPLYIGNTTGNFTPPTEAYGISGGTATGNFTSATQTASSSVSEMGIVVLYKNNEGTASLNTDLVAQVSANGGTNYSNATLVAGGTFSSGINIAAVSGVSVTAGTAPKYKISFANQASGTKETQVHGVALLY